MKFICALSTWVLYLTSKKNSVVEKYKIKVAFPKITLDVRCLRGLGFFCYRYMLCNSFKLPPITNCIFRCNFQRNYAVKSCLGVTQSPTSVCWNQPQRLLDLVFHKRESPSIHLQVSVLLNCLASSNIRILTNKAILEN